MKNIFLAISGGCLVLLGGCTMFTSWKAIPPPGGCDQCHTVPISKNWFFAYQAPTLTNEGSNLEYFQTAQYNMPPTSKPKSSLEVRKVEDLKCFDCHKAPDKAHRERMGRFHH
jgi:hypothetical protein